MANPPAAAPMTPATPAIELTRLISDILDGHEHKPLFRPMEPRETDLYERRKAYVALVKQLGVRYRRCDFSGYKIYEETAPRPDGVPAALPIRLRPSQREVFMQIVDLANHMPDRLATGGGIMLYGRPGTGKDHLLVALAYSAILQWGFSVQWIDGANLYQQARRLFDDRSSEVAFVLRFTKSQILIISDPIPPKGDTSQYSTDVLQRILDRRYRDCRSTWATLNVRDGAEAQERLASPLVSRLRHDSLCLQCDWEDYRGPVNRRPARETKP